jgi:hypothetical protein
MRRSSWLLALQVVLWISPAWADSLPRGARDQLRLYWMTRDPGDLADATGTDHLSAYIFDRFVEEQMPGRISIAALRRDLQLGSFSPTSGSTSIIARPGLTDIISAAMESGAVARKSDANSITFNVNALPVYQLLDGRLPAGCGSLANDCRSGAGRWIRGLSGSVSLNVDGATPVVVAGAGNVGNPLLGIAGDQQIGALSARYELLVRERDAPQLQKALDDAAGQLSSKVRAFLSSQSQFETQLEKLLVPSAWRAQTLQALQAATSLEEMGEILLVRYRLAYDIASSAADLQGVHANTIQEKLNYLAAQNKLLAEKLYRKALTIDYVNQRPTDQPRFHQIRVVASTPLGRRPDEDRIGESTAAVLPQLQLMVNGGVTFFDQVRAGADPGAVRDAQVSAAIDWSPAGWGAVRPTYTAAYYFQYMVENAIIQFDGEVITPGGAMIPLPAPASEVLDTKGAIHVAQVRASIPLGSTGVSFPIAVSFSSRTELVTGRGFWQGHAGVAYDLGLLRDLLRSGPRP